MFERTAGERRARGPGHPNREARAMTRVTMLAAAACVLAWTVPARAAEIKVELKSVHMCCEGCAEAVTTILKKVEGVTGVVVDQKSTTAKFTASDAKAAQKALD